MQPVIRVTLAQHTLVIDRRSVVIGEYDVRLGSILSQPRVQLQNVSGRPREGLLVLRVIADRGQAGGCALSSNGAGLPPPSGGRGRVMAVIVQVSGSDLRGSSE